MYLRRYFSAPTHLLSHQCTHRANIPANTRCTSSDCFLLSCWLMHAGRCWDDHGPTESSWAQRIGHSLAFSFKDTPNLLRTINLSAVLLKSPHTWLRTPWDVFFFPLPSLSNSPSALTLPCPPFPPKFIGHMFTDSLLPLPETTVHSHLFHLSRFSHQYSGHAGDCSDLIFN